MRRLSGLLLLLVLAIFFTIAGGVSADDGRGRGDNEATPTAVATATSVPLPPGWAANVRANTDTAACTSDYTNCSQQEPYIAVNPKNELNAVAAFKDWRDGFKQVYIAITFDGGQTWSNQLPPGLYDYRITNQSDPVVIFGADGAAYVEVLSYGGPDSGVYVSKSSDGGATWGKVLPVVRGGGRLGSDKEWIAIDTNPASPFYNRLYSSWTNVNSEHFNAAYSSDGGQTWSQPTQISNGGTLVSIPAVLPNGTAVVVMYADQASQITVVRSTDGGVSWSAEQKAVDVAGVSCFEDCPAGTLKQTWRIATMPAVAADPNYGTLHMVWLDAGNAANGWDTLYSRSTDAGVTWSAPARLNDDPAGRPRDQVMPTIAVAPDSSIHVAWMDKRDDPNNVAMNLYYTTSTDGGMTWQPNLRLSSAPFDLNVGVPAGSGNAAGDYIGISATSTAVYIAWTDTRNGNEDIYTVRGTRQPSSLPPPPPASTTPAPGSTPPQTTSTDNPRVFSETGKTIGGKFRAFWEAHGGLAQQGYPISNEFQEVSPLDGKTYTVQYFERAVMELHPENPAPNDVLLSQLGSFRYRQKYANGVANQTVNPDNSYRFGLTGHNIGGKFRRYWETHGGLAQQGYPITEEFQEVSELDGKTYTVQYFERAVFELHPENAGTPYEVQLSQLGTFTYKAKYSAAR